MVPKLIPDWRKAWRFHSIRASAVLAALSLWQADVLPALHPIVPEKYWPYVVAGFAVAIGIFRVLAQAELHEDEEPKQ